MDNPFTLSINNSSQALVVFSQSHSLLVDFSRTSTIDEYCFSFSNTDDISSLSFIFVSNIEIDCYFKYLKRNGKTKFVGYKSLKASEHTVDLTDCSEFAIIIPRDKNEDVKTLLTLQKITAI